MEDEYPTYTKMREDLSQEAPVGINSGPEHDILQMVKDGRVSSVLDEGTIVISLAALGHSIETTADALDASPSEVEELAEEERARIAGTLERIEDE